MIFGASAVVRMLKQGVKSCNHSRCHLFGAAVVERETVDRKQGAAVLLGVLCHLRQQGLPLAVGGRWGL